MTIIDTAAACLDEMGLAHTRMPRFPVITLNPEIEAGKLDMFIHAHDDTRLLVYARPAGLLMPPERLQALGEFVNRANYGLPLGNFEIDLNDGELNFKNTVDVTGGSLTPRMVQTVVHFTLEAMNRYLPGLQAVIDGKAPRAVIEGIDGPTRVVIK
jgi:hypothetical protein